MSSAHQCGRVTGPWLVRTAHRSERPSRVSSQFSASARSRNTFKATGVVRAQDAEHARDAEPRVGASHDRNRTASTVHRGTPFCSSSEDVNVGGGEQLLPATAVIDDRPIPRAVSNLVVEQGNELIDTDLTGDGDDDAVAFLVWKDASATVAPPVGSGSDAMGRRPRVAPGSARVVVPGDGWKMSRAMSGARSAWLVPPPGGCVSELRPSSRYSLVEEARSSVVRPKCNSCFVPAMIRMHRACRIIQMSTWSRRHQNGGTRAMMNGAQTHCAKVRRRSSGGSLSALASWASTQAGERNHRRLASSPSADSWRRGPRPPG